MTLYYLLSILFRATSGFKNGAYYGKKEVLMTFLTLLLLGITLTTGILVGGWIQWLYFLPVVPIVWIYAAFLFKKSKWIHAAETFITGLYTLALAFVDLPAAILSVYPGLVLHKIGVNTIAGLPVFYEGTDDPTGKTYNIFLFGKEFHIPRLNFQIRAVLAILSVFGWMAYISYIKPFSLTTILHYVFN